MKSQTTKRKFYNKWLYKVTLSIRGVNIWKLPRFNDHNARLLIPPHDHDIFTLACLLNKLNDYKLRITRSYVDIYTNSKLDFDKIISNFKHCLVHSFIPHDLLKALNDKSVIVDKLPKNRYTFKVYLRPNRLKTVEERNSLIDWMDNQGTKIYITKKVKNWFVKNCYNWDRRYFYIENESTLMLLQIRSPEIIGSIHRYHLTDK